MLAFIIDIYFHSKVLFTIIIHMKSKSLANSNLYLRDKLKSGKSIARSIASSTAIETGESIYKIENKITRQRSAVKRAKLA